MKKVRNRADAGYAPSSVLSVLCLCSKSSEHFFLELPVYFLQNLIRCFLPNGSSAAFTFPLSIEKLIASMIVCHHLITTFASDKYQIWIAKGLRYFSNFLFAQINRLIEMAFGTREQESYRRIFSKAFVIFIIIHNRSLQEYYDSC